MSSVFTGAHESPATKQPQRINDPHPYCTVAFRRNSLLPSGKEIDVWKVHFFVSFVHSTDFCCILANKDKKSTKCAILKRIKLCLFFCLVHILFTLF